MVEEWLYAIGGGKKKWFQWKFLSWNAWRECGLDEEVYNLWDVSNRPLRICSTKHQLRIAVAGVMSVSQSINPLVKSVNQSNSNVNVNVSVCYSVVSLWRLTLLLFKWQVVYITNRLRNVSYLSYSIFRKSLPSSWKIGRVCIIRAPSVHHLIPPATCRSQGYNLTFN